MNREQLAKAFLFFTVVFVLGVCVQVGILIAKVVG